MFTILHLCEHKRKRHSVQFKLHCGLRSIVVVKLTFKLRFLPFMTSPS